MAETLAGRIALITGGGTGIGKSTAEQMAAQGATVIVVGRRQAPLDEVVAAISDNAPTEASAITAVLADPS